MQTPTRYPAYDGFGDIWSDILNPIKSIGTSIEHIYRPIVQAVGHPLLNELHQVEVHVIDPYLKPLIKPIQEIMPKITIDGHRYDLGGSQLLQKAVTGAVGGAASTWFTGYGMVYGAIAGGIAGMLQKGKPNVLANLESGAFAGTLAAGTSALTSQIIPIPGTGMTPSQMLEAGATQQQVNEIINAAAAPGGIANAANAVLMPSVGTIPGTGMTVGEMAVAGASPSDIASAISNANAEIPGTGMTPTDMANAGATPNQISQIQAAANAPGGITNPANATLMPSVGGIATGGSGLTIPQAAGYLSEAAGVGKAALSLAQQTGLIKKPPTPGLTPQQIAAMQTQQAGASSDILPIVAVAAVLGLGIILFTSGD